MIQAFDFNEAIKTCNQLSAKQYGYGKKFGFVSFDESVIAELEMHGKAFYDSEIVSVLKTPLSKLFNKERGRDASDYSMLGSASLQESIESIDDSLHHLLFCSGDALWELAGYHLARVSVYYNVAKYELSERGGKLPEQLGRCFSTYVDDLGEQILQMREQICWAMLARLQVADEMGDLCCDDVRLYILQQQQIFQSKHLPIKVKAKKSLSPELFDVFHAYIKSCGSEQQITQLQNLSWMRPSVDYQQEIRGRRHVFVPKKFIVNNLIPVSVWFKRLAPWAYFRYRFFERNTQVCAQLKRFGYELEQTNAQSYQQLEAQLRLVSKTENQLAELDRQCEQKRPRALMKWLNPKMLSFSDAWRQYSAEQHALLQQVKIATFESYCDHLSYRYEQDDEAELEINCEELKRVKQLLQENSLAAGMVKCRLRLNKCIQVIDELLERYDYDIKIDDVLEEPEPPIDQCQGQALGALSVIDEVDVFELKNKEFLAVSDKVSSAKKQLLGTNNAQLREALEQFDNKLFVAYLRACLQSVTQQKSAEFMTRIDAVEQFLINTGCDYVCSRVSELAKLRCNLKRSFIFKIKCISFLKSCSKDQSLPCNDTLMLLSKNPASPAFDQSSDDQKLIGFEAPRQMQRVR